jgi:tol-pal system protein YbgF
VLPDHVAQLKKDVADVQQELRQIQRSQTEAGAQLETVESRLQQSGEGVQRSEFADLRLQLEEVTRTVAALEERIEETNRRLDRISEETQEARELARRKLATPSPANPASAPAGVGTGTEPAQPDAVPSPEALYNAAYADFSKGNYALAISGFEEYVGRFPDSDLADNALYWVGECHFSQGSFDGAVEVFDRLLERYPKSDRAAAADLKKALAYLEQNQVGQAIVQLRYVTDTYPSTDEARIARDKLTSLGAPAH